MSKLDDGIILAGKPCPFHPCGVEKDSCPSKENILPHDFSCAWARAEDLKGD